MSTAALTEVFELLSPRTPFSTRREVTRGYFSAFFSLDFELFRFSLFFFVLELKFCFVLCSSFLLCVFLGLCCFLVSVGSRSVPTSFKNLKKIKSPALGKFSGNTGLHNTPSKDFEIGYYSYDIKYTLRRIFKRLNQVGFHSSGIHISMQLCR